VYNFTQSSFPFELRFLLMPAHIISLAPLPERPQSAPQAPEDRAPQRRYWWRGASGRRYEHAVYSLVGCPALRKASYVLVHRDHRGRCRALHIGYGESEAPSLNLARIRQRGATLGANEVHVHFHASTDEQRRLVACDLRAGQFGALGPEPSRPVYA